MLVKDVVFSIKAAFYFNRIVAKRNLQIATASISTNVLISIFSWQIFADKNTAKQYLVAWQ